MSEEIRLAIDDSRTTIHPTEALYVDVVLGVPQDEPYQYAVPDALRSQVAVGKRVKVPLGNQTRFGYIVGVSGTPKVASLKEVAEIIDPEPFVNQALLELTRWISETYFCSWGQALEAAMPGPFKKGKTTMKARPPKVKAEREFLHASPGPHELTEDQVRACGIIARALDSRQTATFVLHGVTGSGKTEIYLALIQKLLDEGRGAIVLVPEISLTPQTTDRFESRFAGKVAVIHSRLAAGKRLEEWHRIRRGEAKVVVGARSAVFSPVPSLGLVVIDEEHDDSYKQDDTPRYDAWLTARKRCEIEGAVLVRASATPRLESVQEALDGSSTLIRLAKRIEDRPLPEVQVIDMRTTRQSPIFSQPLEKAVKDALANGEQVMLFLNRRGYSPFVSCLTCGWVADCPNCRVSLVLHYDQGLICHTCHFRMKAPRLCPACDKGYVRYLGAGTEKVESEAHRLFPAARIERMDTDTTKKAGSHARILKAFRKKEIDILLGTQMITKGHDFPGVSVIGVISADTALHLPDFRSAERAFDILTQVAGRAGRDNVRGKVFIQTFVPSHYAIVAAKDHDYGEFYEKEIGFRRELRLPPFSRMVQVLVAARMERDVAKRSLELRRHTEEAAAAASIDIMGPAPCLLSKRKGMYLWNLYYKGSDAAALNSFLRERLKTFNKSGVRITLDADPR